MVWRKIAELACIRGQYPNCFSRVGPKPGCSSGGGGNGGARSWSVVYRVVAIAGAAGLPQFADTVFRYLWLADNRLDS